MSTPLPAKPLLETLRKTPLVFDGAMGTQLYERGIVFSACFEELNVTRPDLVARVHEEYVRAGAQVLETNSFGANALRLDRHGLSGRVTELNEAAVRVARSAALSTTFVVGADEVLLSTESAVPAVALVSATARATMINSAQTIPTGRSSQRTMRLSFITVWFPEWTLQGADACVHCPWSLGSVVIWQCSIPTAAYAAPVPATAASALP